jgi:hypothetical protein
MTCVIMTADTVKFFIVDHTVRGNFSNKFPMAIKAVGIQNRRIPLSDPNWILEIPKRESQGMVVAIFSF